MRKHIKTIGVICSIAIVGVLAYTAGYTRAYWRGLDQLKFETQGNLSFHVEELARLRTGDNAGATELLERSVDRAIETLPMGKQFVVQGKTTQQILSQVKMYRRTFPSNDPAVNATLSDVPLLPVDHRYCSPALDKVTQLGPQSVGS